MRRLQREDSNLVAYLQDGRLPDDEHAKRKVVLESQQFDVVDGVLYQENPNSSGRSCFVVPEGLHLAILTESHKGRFDGHLSEKKVYDRLRCHVWWQGMKSYVHKFCQSCLHSHSYDLKVL